MPDPRAPSKTARGRHAAAMKDQRPRAGSARPEMRPLSPWKKQKNPEPHPAKARSSGQRPRPHGENLPASRRISAPRPIAQLISRPWPASSNTAAGKNSAVVLLYFETIFHDTAIFLGDTSKGAPKPKKSNNPRFFPKKRQKKPRFHSENGVEAEKPGFEPGRRLSHPTPLAEIPCIFYYYRNNYSSLGGAVLCCIPPPPEIVSRAGSG